MFESGLEGEIDRRAPVPVMVDGVKRRQQPGEVLLLGPGESVTLRLGYWHKFRREGGDVLIGEVSTVNDDLTDNIFEDSIGRFAYIVEDVAPKRFLVSDYDTFLNNTGNTRTGWSK